MPACGYEFPRVQLDHFSAPNGDNCFYICTRFARYLDDIRFR